MFKLIKNDLVFILDQIKVAERHVQSNYTAYVDGQGNAIGNLTPYGLRTVSGVYNNLVHTDSGAADEVMPRLLTPTLRAAGDNIFIPGVQMTSYAQPTGTVFDAAPRTISNLVSDQSVTSLAALTAALGEAGMGQTQALAYARDFVVRYAAQLAVKPGSHTTLEQAVAGAMQASNEAQARLATAQADLAAAQQALQGFTAAQADLSTATAAVEQAELALAAAQSEAAAALQLKLAAQATQTAQANALVAATAQADGARQTLAQAADALAQAQLAQSQAAAGLQQAQDAAAAAEAAYQQALNAQGVDGGTAEGSTLLEAMAARETAATALSAANAELVSAQAAQAAAQQAFDGAAAALAVAQGQLASQAAGLDLAQSAHADALARQQAAVLALGNAEAAVAAAQAQEEARTAEAATAESALLGAEGTLNAAQAAVAAATQARDAALEPLQTAQAALEAAQAAHSLNEAALPALEAATQQAAQALASQLQARVDAQVPAALQASLAEYAGAQSALDAAAQAYADYLAQGGVAGVGEAFEALQAATPAAALARQAFIDATFATYPGMAQAAQDTGAALAQALGTQAAWPGVEAQLLSDLAARQQVLDAAQGELNGAQDAALAALTARDQAQADAASADAALAQAQQVLTDAVAAQQAAVAAQSAADANEATTRVALGEAVAAHELAQAGHAAALEQQQLTAAAFATAETTVATAQALADAKASEAATAQSALTVAQDALAAAEARLATAEQDHGAATQNLAAASLALETAQATHQADLAALPALQLGAEQAAQALIADVQGRMQAQALDALQSAQEAYSASRQTLDEAQQAYDQYLLDNGAPQQGAAYEALQAAIGTADQARQLLIDAAVQAYPEVAASAQAAGAALASGQQALAHWSGVLVQRQAEVSALTQALEPVQQQLDEAQAARLGGQAALEQAQAEVASAELLLAEAQAALADAQLQQLTAQANQLNADATVASAQSVLQGLVQAEEQAQLEYDQALALQAAAAPEDQAAAAEAVAAALTALEQAGAARLEAQSTYDGALVLQQSALDDVASAATAVADASGLVATREAALGAAQSGEAAAQDALTAAENALAAAQQAHAVAAAPLATAQDALQEAQALYQASLEALPGLESAVQLAAQSLALDVQGRLNAQDALTASMDAYVSAELAQEAAQSAYDTYLAQGGTPNAGELFEALQASTANTAQALQAFLAAAEDVYPGSSAVAAAQLAAGELAQVRQALQDWPALEQQLNADVAAKAALAAAAQGALDEATLDRQTALDGRDQAQANADAADAALAQAQQALAGAREALDAAAADKAAAAADLAAAQATLEAKAELRAQAESTHADALAAQALARAAVETADVSVAAAQAQAQAKAVEAATAQSALQNAENTLGAAQDDLASATQARDAALAPLQAAQTALEAAQAAHLANEAALPGLATAAQQAVQALASELQVQVDAQVPAGLQAALAEYVGAQSALDAAAQAYADYLAQGGAQGQGEAFEALQAATPAAALARQAFIDAAFDTYPEMAQAAQDAGAALAQALGAQAAWPGVEAQLLSEVAARQQVLDAAQSELNGAQGAELAALAARDQAQANADAADAALVQAQQALADARTVLQAQVDAKQLADDALALAGGTLAAAVAAHDASSTALAQAQAQAAATRTALDSALDRLAQETQEQAQAQAQLQQAQAAQATAQAAYDDMVQDRLAQLLLEQQQAQAEVARLASELAQLEAQVADLTGAHSQAQTALDTAQSQLLLAQAAKADADARLADATAVHDAAAQAATQAAGELDAARGAQDEAQAAVDAFADELAARDTAQAALNQAEADRADATTALNAAQQALDTARAQDQAAVEQAQTNLQDMLQDLRDQGVVLEGSNPADMTVVVPNVMADLGDTAPFNSFMTLFGQFFDHGLDLIGKGGNGTVYMPLQPDDPLYVAGSPTNFMVLTRATNLPGADGILGTADDVREQVNKTTPWIDLNQVYTSHESHQVFLREYALVDGRPQATGHMLEGANGGPPTWADVKAQARDVLGIELTDAAVSRVPLVATDLYGNFIPGANGFAQLVTANGLVEGNPAAPASAALAIATGHAFLEDIAHNAAPVVANGVLQADADDVTGNAVPADARGNKLAYDNELLDKHYIVGDGRGNENIGLTAVHHVFHSEHNNRVEQIKHELIAAAEAGDIAFLNQWLSVPVEGLPQNTDELLWNGERLFHAARFSTEMVYQHLVFEEFARLVSPNVDPFVFSNTVEIDAGIFAEFAHVVYRFGHSMLTETIDRISADGQANDQIGLIEAFLNPVEFAASGVDAEGAAGAIIRGMSRQVGNEIDEFLTEALRNNLVGLPLDLGALNIARGRDTGVPSLNEARRQFFEGTSNSTLKPYESWADFTTNLKNPVSVINFIAAYGTHSSIVNATTMEDKRAAAMALVLGGSGAPADRVDFLTAQGAWAGGSLGGLNDVDFWIGGLAEAKMPFGGLLGSTFNFVFEMQMEQLQAGDRFYYLSRTQGTNLLNNLEADSFAELVMRNTDLGDANATHLPSSLFLTPAYTLELDQMRQRVADPVSDDPFAIRPLVIRRDVDGDGDGDLLQFTGGDHVVLGGTNENDTLIGGAGDDTIWGDDGDDRIEGGLGVDHLFAGEGNDIITDAGNDVGAGDVIHGGGGHDVINGGMGLDLIFGQAGQDFVYGGTDELDITGGLDNDFLRGGNGNNFVKGSEGDDWVEGGAASAGFDGLAGDNSELFFNSRVIGHDVLNGRDGDTDYDGESGDDIMVQALGIQRNNGMAGFDWAIHKGDAGPADSDLGISAFALQQDFILRDRFDLVEGLSGWNHDDRLTGRDTPVGQRDGGAAAIIDPTAPYASYSNTLTQQGVERISGLDQLVAHLDRVSFTVAGEQQTVVVFDPAAVQLDAAGNVTGIDEGVASPDILLGGGGSDILQGKGGNDVIDGDRWLNVRIAIKDAQGNELGTADHMGGRVYDNATGATLYGGRTLDALMFSGVFHPGQLSIVREILDGDAANAAQDVAVYRGLAGEYDLQVNEDGSLTVTHARPVNPVLADGSDRVINVETLRFADGDLAVADVVTPRPIITSDGGADTANALVSENTLAVTTVTATESFPSGRPLVFSLVNTADAALFTIDSATGTLSFINAPDFEQRSVFDVVVQVSNGVRTDTQALAIDISNVDEASTGSVRLSFAADAADASATLTAGNDLNDPDGFVGPITYQWQRLVGGVWTDIAGGADGTLGSVSGATLRAVANYQDPFGAKSVTSQTVAQVGTAAADALAGTAGAEQLVGLGGNDTLTGAGGNDTVDAGTGDDLLRASVADGDDAYVGGEGVDTYTLGATAAAAIVDLRAGTATSADTGLDTLAGVENVTGGSGADLFVMAQDDVRNVITGGAGSDTVDYGSASAALSVTLNGGSLATVNGSGTSALTADQIAGVENFTSGSGNDTLRGDANANRLDGGAGNDELQASLNDGNDVHVGGEGVDTYSLAATAAGATVNFRTGTSTSAQTGTDSLISIENVVGSTASDSFLMAQDEVRNVIQGGTGTDTADYASSTNNLSVALNGAALATVIGSGSTTLASDQIAGVENFVGGSGNDTLRGDTLTNRLDGGAGNDLFEGAEGDGNDILIGGAGEDTYSLATLTVAVTATLAAGTVVGAGTDNVSGVENVIGGSAADSLTGDGGANRLMGGGGNDALTGGAGSDVLDGGAGDDSLRASVGDGDDAYLGGAGVDTYSLAATAAAAVVNLPAGTATSAETGSDTLVGVENVTGGSGNDLFILGTDNVRNTITGGTGSDTVDYSAATADLNVGLNGTGLVTVNGSATTPAAADQIAGIENVVGGSGNDTLRGDANANRLDGGAGNDTLQASVGDGDDVYIGGAGIDTYSLALTTAAATVDLRLGTSSSAVTGTDTLQAVENVTGGTGADRFVMAVDDVRNVINGGDGSDTADFSASTANLTIVLNGVNPATVAGSGSTALTSDQLLAVENVIGGSGNDVMRSDNRDNRFDGGAGDDVFEAIGSAAAVDGNDTYIGGLGEDTYSLSTVSVSVTANLATGTATGVGNDTLSGIEHLTGGTAADRLTGDAGNNRLAGGLGSDVLEGGAGDDRLDGGGNADTAVFDGLVRTFTFGQSALTVSRADLGTDTLVSVENLQFTDGVFAVMAGTGGVNGLTGGAGREVIFGLDGNDIIGGSTGADVLAGGAGNDSYTYSAVEQSSAAERDLIADFVKGSDRINLSVIDANTEVSAAGNQAFAFTAGQGTGEFTAAGQLRYFYDAQTNLTVVQGNTDADTTTVELEVALVGNHALTLGGTTADIVA